MRQYVKDIIDIHAIGNATEHSYRGALAQMVKRMAPQIRIVNEPKHEACGAPDYVILTQDKVPLGFIEAKDIGDSDLAGEGKNKEQFDRYKEASDNLIFTDYLTFRFYHGKVEYAAVSVGELSRGKIRAVPAGFGELEHRLQDFCTYVSQTIRSAEKLAVLMAGKARLLADIFARALAEDAARGRNSTLSEQLEVFKQMLIRDIDIASFADLYSQTIAYGMLAARLHDPTLDDFSRSEAAKLIPRANPFLRKLFAYIAGPDIDERIELIVDNLASIFQACDARELLRASHAGDDGSGGVIYFYETFLTAYDPEKRKARGVYYTPKAVVRFMVGAVDELLQDAFHLREGLADTSSIPAARTRDEAVRSDAQAGAGAGGIEEYHRVQILDPATGTGTFLGEVIACIHSRFATQQGVWNSYVEEHLLPRLHGFELLMASYAMAHLHIEELLRRTGFAPGQSQRIPIYLTNSLEDASGSKEVSIPFSGWLSEEVNDANRIKRDTPVMVVIGNPPYSGESRNKGEWITDLVSAYKKEPDSKINLQERKHWLDDDYVKFIRCGQYYIDRSGEGILTYINNHGFLDNPTFRGMRWSLLQSFDRIYILDLHGNAKKKERASDDSVDENVFAIQQGVSINIFVKDGQDRDREERAQAQVLHYDLYGTREEKYRFLQEHRLSAVQFQTLQPQAPYYFFVPKDYALQAKYNEGFSVNELFMEHSVGIVTARDNFTIYHTPQELKSAIEQFRAMDDETARIHFSLGKDVTGWKVQLARKDLEDNVFKNNNDRPVTVNYRPFDIRYTYYTGNSKGFHCRPLGKVMHHFLAGKNVGLALCKQFKAFKNYQHVFVSNNIFESSLVSNRTSEIGYGFPLYLYPDDKELVPATEQKRTPNLKMDIVNRIADTLGLRFTPEQEAGDDSFAPLDLLDYIYAVLHAPSYRRRYRDFLKSDFPRLPYPNDATQFRALVALGAELRALHLMEHPRLEQLITGYPVAGDNVVGAVRYQLTDGAAHVGAVFINERQHFSGVPEVAWELYIGGYQPAQKWLKARKGRRLVTDDIRHYQRIVVALTETAQLAERVDGVVGIFQHRTGTPPTHKKSKFF